MQLLGSFIVSWSNTNMLLSHCDDDALRPMWHSCRWCRVIVGMIYDIQYMCFMTFDAVVQSSGMTSTHWRRHRDLMRSRLTIGLGLVIATSEQDEITCSQLPAKFVTWQHFNVLFLSSALGSMMCVCLHPLVPLPNPLSPPISPTCLFTSPSPNKPVNHELYIFIKWQISMVDHSQHNHRVTIQL